MALRETIRVCGLPVDDRGLVELELARRTVATAREFRRGRGTTIGSDWVWESERLWACLMSLKDAAEFVREASRLEWHFHPRASQNLEPAERYGKEVLPWLLSREVDGVLYNVPFCVLPLLVHLAGQEAFDLLLRIDAVAADDARFPGPFSPEGPGDVESSELSVSETAAKQALLTFAWDNPAPSFSLLYEQAVVSGSARAREVLLAALAAEPTKVFAYIAEDWDEAEARSDLLALGATLELTEARILAALDEGCRAGDPWPIFRAGHPDRAYVALRMLAFREVDGDDWAVVFECLEGSSPEALCLKRYLVTPTLQKLADRSGQAELFLDGAWSEEAANRLVGPCGDLLVTREQLAQLEPLRATVTEGGDLHYSLLVRAYLEENPGAFWTDEDVLVRELELEGVELVDFQLLLATDAFEHVVGTASDAFDPAGIDAKWRLLPSESPVYRSLARTIVTRDAESFEPGESNLDWRLHLDRPNRAGG
jgi:hypothetical protein